MKFVAAALVALASLVGVDAYTFPSNSSAHQRLDLHEKHSSFGEAVAVQGVIALVSAPHYSFNSFKEADGIVYVYRRDYNYWTLIRGITDIEYADQFGVSLAMHTDYFAVVGAPNANHYGKRSGCAYYMYVETDPYATQKDTVQIVQSERHEGAAFGSSVAVGTVGSDVVVAVGAPGHRGRGAVFTYIRMSDGTLSNEEILYTSDDGSDKDTAALSLGLGVAVGYNMVLGGCPGGKRGYVYIFERMGAGVFSESSILTGVSGYQDDNDDEQYHPYENLKQVEEFGKTIVVGNGYVFVGAPYAYTQTDHGTNYGKVTIFSFTPSTSTYGSATFLLFQTITPNYLPGNGMNSLFGISLSYDSNEKRLVIGSPYGSYPATDLGYASVFLYNSYDAKFDIETVLDVNSYKPNTNDGDMENFGETERAGFGSSVSVDGAYILVGAPMGAAHYGDAYFFVAEGVSSAVTETFYEMITNNMFTSFGLVLFPIAIIGLVMIILLWRKYKDSNYDDSFSQFIIDEVSEFFGNVGSEGMNAVDSCTSLQFMGEDDSAHSTHPMIVGTSVSTKKKVKKSKSSKFKSKTNVGAYESANFEENL